jgi:hypothetical protein
MSRKFLYSRLGLSVIAIVMVLATAWLRSAGQGKPELKRPQETPDEKPAEPKKTKKVKGPRAVGILQFGLAKTTLIPVAILVDGKFYDASVYKADPVPMALETGTVYEAEKSGESQGLFTTNGALHSKSKVSVNPWLGTGTYLPHGTEAHRTTHKAEDVPVGLDNSGDEPPRLTRKSGSSSGSSSPSGPAAEKPSTDKPKATESSEKGSTDNKSSSGDATKGTGSSSDKTGDQGKAESPGSSAAGHGPSGQTPQGPSGKSAASENYYRPTLRRGKPTQAAPEEDELAAKTASSGAAMGSTAASGAKVVQFVPAISDSGGPDPQSYQFFWKEGEEEERRKQMLALAGQELRAYLNTRAKGTIPAAVRGRKAERPRRKAGAKPAAPAFENIQFRAFDVWKNNQPVMILSAEAHFPAGPGMVTAPETYNITLASRTDIYGSLRKLYSGVTDRFHLDVTPRLELIDVVDADGDGRGELLFRETTDAGNGYVIYRATGDKLWKMFDSLGGE